MFLNLQDEKIEKYFKNCYEVKREDGTLQPVRFSHKQMSIYSETKAAKIRSACPSSIYLEMKTDSSFINIKLEALDFARDFLYLDIYIDDIFLSTVGVDAVKKLEDSIYIDLSYEHIDRREKKEKRERIQKVSIYLPHLVDIRIKEIEIEDASFIEDCSEEEKEKKKILCFGDSITQGMTSKRPSTIFPSQLGKFFSMKVLNQGVGGYVFDENIIDEEMNISPHIITVAYGINDWFQHTSIDYFQEKCSGFLNKLVRTYEKAEIFLITPIWSTSENELKAMGNISAIRKIIEDIGKEYSRIHLVDGLKMVPNIEDYYVDGLHPNEAGFMHYSINLAKEIKANI